MLHLLKEYAQRHGLQPEAGFASKEIRWCIAFTASGECLDVIELGDAESRRNRGRRFARCPDYSFSEMRAGGVIKSHFLVDTAEVVVGHSVKPDDEKIQAKHSYFIDLLGQASKALPIFAAIKVQLEDAATLEKLRRRFAELKAKPTEKVTFMVGESFPIEESTWHGWWQEHRSTMGPEKPSGPKMRSFVTGRLAEPARTHERKIKLSDAGGIASGDVLIGFKQESFQSFGLPQSFNAAVEESEVYAYADALNHILQTSSYRIADTKIGYWFKERVPAEDDPLPWLVQGDEQEELSAKRRVHDLLDSIRSGQRTDLQDNSFYAITVSGTGGRVMVRDWMEGQFEGLVQRVDQWFDDLTITNLSGARFVKNPGLERVVTCLLPPRGRNQKYEDWIKPLGPARLGLWQTAVRGDPIPWSCVVRIVNAHRSFCVTGALEEAEKTKNDLALTLSLLYARMGLLKAYHSRRDRIEGKEPTMQPYLNENHPHPAYHCGRLLAVLAGLQRSALGDVGAGVVQRYYTAAAATPALVLGRITGTSQHHLAKLEGGLSHWYEKQIADIWSQLKDTVPGILTLEEQSLFALGYYQQLALLRTKKSTTNNVTENSHE